MAATSLSRNSTSDGRLSNLSCSWKNQTKKNIKKKKKKNAREKGKSEERRSEAGLYKRRSIVKNLVVPPAERNQTNPDQTKINYVNQNRTEQNESEGEISEVWRFRDPRAQKNKKSQARSTAVY